MAGIWIYSEDTMIAQQLLSLGRETADKMQQALCAATLDAQAAQALVEGGADKVVVLKGDNLWPESFAPALTALAAEQSPTVLFIGATLRGKDLAAKVAAGLKTGLVTDAQAVRIVDGNIETDRMMYGGLAVCTEILGPMSLVTIPPRAYEPAVKQAGRSGEIITVEVATPGDVVVGSVCPIARKGIDITTAEKLVCVGRGIGKQADMKLAFDLAEAVGGEVACTRSIAEDYHWLPAENYIGLSGQKVKPLLYLALGVSGQVQHIAGIRDAKIIVAVDINENAPIFEAADYGIVGDLYEIAPLLTEAAK